MGSTSALCDLVDKESETITSWLNAHLRQVNRRAPSWAVICASVYTGAVDAPPVLQR